MPTDTRRYSRPHHLPCRQSDRRKVNMIKGVPLMGGLGLVVHDRRSHRERRHNRRDAHRPPPCALLQGQNRGGQAAALVVIGTWIKRCLTYRWRG